MCSCWLHLHYLFCLAKAGLQRWAVPEVSYSQGLYLIQGRGPEASGNFTVCALAEMWKLAQGPPGHMARGSCLPVWGGQLVGPAPAPAPHRAPCICQGHLCRRLSSFRRGGAGVSVPQIFEEKRKKMCMEKSRQNRQSSLRKRLGSHCSRSIKILFSFLLKI